MDAAALRALLASIPEPPGPPGPPGAPGSPESGVPPVADAVIDALVDASVRYLASPAAADSLARDTYWPKWDSPWWHMLLLHELGLADRIPPAIVARMVDRLDALPLHHFPIHPGDRPPGADPWRDSTCHCAIGNLHQVLTACGVDVRAALPWLEPWFARYQLPDGGANCDETAYLSGEPDASSMVAIIATMEAALGGRAGAVSPEATARHRDFLARAAGFLVDRRLVEGSRSRHNAEERESARAWPLLGFPRFYFYDVLRGLTALVRWADSTAAVVPLAVVAPVAAHLAAAFPDGVARVGRRALDLHPTTIAFVGGAWGRHPTSSFPLLDAVSVVGAASAPLTREWTDTRRAIVRLADSGRLA